MPFFPPWQSGWLLHPPLPLFHVARVPVPRLLRRHGRPPPGGGHHHQHLLPSPGQALPLPPPRLPRGQRGSRRIRRHPTQPEQVHRVQQDFRQRVRQLQVSNVQYYY